VQLHQIKSIALLPDSASRWCESIQLRSTLLKGRGRGADMVTDSLKRSDGHPARRLLLLLVTVPLLPELFIWVVAAIAGLAGCKPSLACENVSPTVSDMIEGGLWAAGIVRFTWSTYFHLAIGAWLVVCLLLLLRGWAGATSRLLIGAAVTLFFAVLFVFGPWFAVYMVADANTCNPQKRTGCFLFGGAEESVRGAFQKADHGILNEGTLLLVGIFVVFAIFVIASGTISAKRAIGSEHGQP
jgi:hypothetical protein